MRVLTSGVHRWELGHVGPAGRGVPLRAPGAHGPGVRPLQLQRQPDQALQLLGV